MATINVKLSQNVVDQQHTSELNTPVLNGSIGTLVDAIAVADHAVSTNYPYYSSWSLAGTTLRFVYPDGATSSYTGLVRADPNAFSGSATATGFEFNISGVMNSSATGTFNYDYVITQSGTDYSLSIAPSSLGISYSSLRVATQLPTTSPAYTQLTGNVAVVINGAVKLGSTGMLTGNLSKITSTADKFLLSAVIEGDFKLSSNLLTDGQGLTHSSVDGTLTGYHENFRDGSLVDVTGVAAHIGASQVLDDRIFANSSYFSGNDVISLELPAHSYRDFLMASGDGDDQVSIKGGGGRLNVAAGNGNDQITILGDAHAIDGGNGMDVVKVASVHSDYTLKRADAVPGSTQTGPVYSLTDKAGAVSTLVNVERIVFVDATVSLDFEGNGGQAYRLYQAAFNRTPDAGGLGFWIRALDDGMTLTSVAQGFVNSGEFKTAYGASPTNHDLVTQFYQNILHRAPESGGLDFWAGVLDSKAAGVPDVLAAISESAENKAGLIGVIGNGFTYTPFNHS